MATGFRIASAHVHVDADTRSAISSIKNLISTVALLGPVAGVAGGALVAGVAGTVAAYGAAGIAIGAFGAAVVPQLSQVTKVADLYTAAQEAQAKGGKEAAEAQKAYTDALAKLPPATRDTAVAFAGLKTDFKAWSDSLAGTTMPVFTKGIGILRGMLPSLTPLVKTAAGAFGDFLGDIGKSVKDGSFDKMIKNIDKVAKQTLPDLLSTIKSIGSGLGGIFKAFAPEASKMSGGINDVAAKFAKWGQSLGQSQGFKSFMDYIKENGPKLLETLGSIAMIIGNVVMAIAPFTGLTMLLVSALSKLLALIPPEVITTIMAIALGFKLWGLAIGLVNLALGVTPLGWLLIGIGLLVVAIVWIATKTTWFQTAWTYTWNFIKSITGTVVGGIVAFFQMLGRFFTETIPRWFTTVKNGVISAWNWVKNKTIGIWNSVVLWLTIKFNHIVAFVLSTFASIKSGISKALTAVKKFFTDIWNSIVGWVTGRWNSLKSTASRIFNGIRSAISNAINSAKSAVLNAVGRISGTISGIKGKVMNALSGAGRWLYNAGRSIIQGLVNGIRNMAGAVKNAVSGVLQKARNLLPFSPAREGPFSGKGWTLYSGQSMMTGLAQGIDSKSAHVKNAMSSSVQGVSNARAVNGGGGSGGIHIAHLDVRVEGSFDMSSAVERKAVARAIAADIKEELRKTDKERAR